MKIMHRLNFHVHVILAPYITHQEHTQDHLSTLLQRGTLKSIVHHHQEDGHGLLNVDEIPATQDDMILL